MKINLEQAKERYQAGARLREIAAELGCTESGISKAFSRAGVEVTPRGMHGYRKLSVNQRHYIMILHKQGLSKEEIAEKYGVSPALIQTEIERVTSGAYRSESQRGIWKSIPTNQRRARTQKATEASQECPRQVRVHAGRDAYAERKVALPIPTARIAYLRECWLLIDLAAERAILSYRPRFQLAARESWFSFRAIQQGEAIYTEGKGERWKLHQRASRIRTRVQADLASSGLADLAWLLTQLGRTGIL